MTSTLYDVCGRPIGVLCPPRSETADPIVTFTKEIITLQTLKAYNLAKPGSDPIEFDVFLECSTRDYLKNILKCKLVDLGFTFDDEKEDIDIFIDGKVVKEDDKLFLSIYYSRNISFRLSEQKQKYVHIHFAGLTKPVAYIVEKDQLISSLVSKIAREMYKDPSKISFIIAGKKVTNDQSIVGSGLYDIGYAFCRVSE
jgi:hypothetical protein